MVDAKSRFCQIDFLGDEKKDANGFKILVDTKTGVNYFAPWNWRRGIMSLCPIFDKDGKVVITPSDELEKIVDPVGKTVSL